MSKPPAPSDLADKFMLRMPEGLRERIKLASDASKRSMNAEIVSALEQAFPPDPPIDRILGELESYLEIALEDHNRHALMRAKQAFLKIKAIDDAGNFTKAYLRQQKQDDASKKPD